MTKVLDSAIENTESKGRKELKDAKFRGETTALISVAPCGIAFMSDVVRHNSRIVQPIAKRAALRSSMDEYDILQDAKGTLTGGYAKGEKLLADTFISAADRKAELAAREKFCKELPAEKQLLFKAAGYLDENRIVCVPVNGLQRSQVALEKVLDGKPCLNDFQVEIQVFSDVRAMLVYSSMLNELDSKTSIRVTVQDRVPFAEKIFRMGATRKDFLSAFPPGTGPKLFGLLTADALFPNEKIWEKIVAGIGATIEKGKPVPAGMLIISRIPQEIGTKENYSTFSKVREIIKTSRRAPERGTKTSMMDVEELQALGLQSKDATIRFVCYCILESQKDFLVKGILGIKLDSQFVAPENYFNPQAEQEQAEQEKAEKPKRVRKPKAEKEQAAPEQAATEQAATEQAATEQAATEQAAPFGWDKVEATEQAATE